MEACDALTQKIGNTFLEVNDLKGFSIMASFFKIFFHEYQIWDETDSRPVDRWLQLSYHEPHDCISELLLLFPDPWV